MSSARPHNLRATELWRKHGAAASWALPLLLYAVLAAILVPLHWERINPDAIAYIRRALYITQGDFASSVSGYWSPMISWCIAPLMLAGMDGLHAAHLVLAIWGGVFVMTFNRLLRSLGLLEDGWVMGATTAAALLVIPNMVHTIAPDVIMAACLFAYLSMVASDDLLDSRRTQLLAGVLGGVAYLAKAYALPVVVVHLPFAIAMRLYAHGRLTLQGILRAARTFLVSGALLAIVAGAWIAVLSKRYGRLTISTSGPINHALVGPRGATVRQPAFGLQPDPFIAPIENPDRNPVIDWSPMESWDNFKHQLAVVGINLKRLVEFIDGFAALHLAVPALAVTPLIVLALRRRRQEQTRLLWLVGTIAIYCSGLMTVWLTPRYIVAVVLPLSLILVLKMALAWRASPSSRPTVRRLAIAGPALLLLAFAWPALDDIAVLFQPKRPKPYRQVAGAVQSAGLSGPVATSDRQKGQYVAFFLGEKFLNFPPEQDPADAEQALRDFGAGMVLIWRDRDGYLTDGRTVLVSAGDTTTSDHEEDDDTEPARPQARSMGGRRLSRPKVAAVVVQRPGWRLGTTFELRWFGRVEAHVPPWQSAPATKRATEGQP